MHFRVAPEMRCKSGVGVSRLAVNTGNGTEHSVSSRQARDIFDSMHAIERQCYDVTMYYNERCGQYVRTCTVKSLRPIQQLAVIFRYIIFRGQHRIRGVIPTESQTLQTYNALSK